MVLIWGIGVRNLGNVVRTYDREEEANNIIKDLIEVISENVYQNIMNVIIQM